MSKKIKVLIVDDDQYGFDLLEEVLSGSCYVLEKASDGVMALDKMESFNPDIVLLDYIMPRMDGIEAIQIIREFDPRARIVVLTGNTIQEDLDRVNPDDVMKILRKPFDIPTLLALVNSEGALGARH